MEGCRVIFYFSGTGNSKYAAMLLARRLDTELVSIAAVLRGRAFRVPAVEEPVGIVFPVYAWAPPELVLRFVKAHPFPAARHTFAVCTCGDDAGEAMRALGRARGKPYDSTFSIAMPNNFILGFDVDSPAEAARKLQAADERLIWIAERLAARDQGIHAVHKGRAPGLKTALAAPLLNLGKRWTRPFHAGDACTACGRCARVCPTGNIRLQPRPVWGKDCACCLACLHHCPTRAIDYGRLTQKKGWYVNPRCAMDDDTAAQVQSE